MKHSLPYACVSILAAISLCSGALWAEASRPVIAFGTPEVTKLDWSTRSLNVADLNADGYHDLILINNDRTQIQSLILRPATEDARVRKIPVSSNRWDPVLEDSRYDRSELTVGFPVFDLTVGDFNADGMADIAYTAGNVPLSIRFQEGEGRWSEPREYDAFEALGWPNTLQADDLDGDGSVELVILGADAFRVLGGAHRERADELQAYYLTGENPFNLLLADVNADGLKDVLYLTSSGEQSLALRLQLASGDFGPEIRFPLERPFRVLTVVPHKLGESPTFCGVDGRSGGLEFFELTVGDGASSASALRPEVFPLFQGSRNAPAYSMADLNDDGVEDLLISSPVSAELYLFAGAVEGGFLAPKRYPTFSEVSSQGVGHFFEQAAPRLVSLSERESIVGISYLASNGRVTFPAQIELGTGKPLICEVIDWNNDGLDELALITEEKGAMRFVLMQPENRSDPDGPWQVIESQELEGLKRAPIAMRQVDLFQKDASGLMLFVARDAPIFLQLRPHAAEGRVSEFAKDSSIRQSFLKGIAPAQVTLADLNGDGQDAILVGRTGYARLLQVAGDDLEMVDQFNARRSADEVSAVLPEIELESGRYLGLYVKSAGELQLLERDGDGVYRYNRTELLGNINLVTLPLSMGESEGYVMAGDDRFWILRPDGLTWRRVVQDSFETDLEDVRYTDVGVTDFDADGIWEIVAVDGQNHVVEILQAETAGWRSLMYWEIFEQNMHYQGRTGGKLEPREMKIADLTGDGQTEFIFLIHDRLLLYPQE